MDRDHAWYGCVPSLKTTRFGAARPTAAAFPDVIDLRQWSPPIMDQGPAGTCTAHGLRRAMNHAINKRALSYAVDFSRLYAYWWARRKESPIIVDQGAQIADIISVGIDKGVPTEDSWAYDLSKINLQPPDLGFESLQWKVLSAQPVPTNIEGVKTALMDGHPVIIGISVFASFEGPDVAKTGIVPMPRLGEAMVGGHCMVIEASDATMKGHVDVPNSWGTDWGKEGSCFIPYEYLSEFGSDFWTIKLVGSENEQKAGVVQ